MVLHPIWTVKTTAALLADNEDSMKVIEMLSLLWLTAKNAFLIHDLMNWFHLEKITNARENTEEVIFYICIYFIHFPPSATLVFKSQAE